MSEGEPAGEQRVDGKCAFCNKEQGHAHDCPIFEHDLHKIAEEGRMKELHTLSGETEESLQKKKDLNLTLEEQIAAIERGMNEPVVEKTKSERDQERVSRYSSELKDEFFSISNLLDQLNAKTTWDYIASHPKLNFLSEQLGELVQRYGVLLHATDRKRMKEPEYLIEQYGPWHMLNVDLKHFKHLLADYQHSS